MIYKKKCCNCSKQFLATRTNRKMCSHACAVAYRLSNTVALNSPAPFIGYRVYGPRVENAGRTSVSLVESATGAQATMTLARYIMCVGLGRVLECEFEVDHVDMDPCNEHWKNLQVLSVSANAKKGGIHTFKCVRFACAVCKTYKVMVDRRGGKQHKILFCSRDCQHKFQHLSKNYQLEEVVAAAIKTNAVMLTDEMKSTVKVKRGVRITRITKNLKIVAEFLARKGVNIL